MREKTFFALDRNYKKIIVAIYTCIYSKRGNKMKNAYAKGKEFWIVYLIIVALDFTVPFLLPSKMTGAYLFWIILTILTILYGIFSIDRQI